MIEVIETFDLTKDPSHINKLLLNNSEIMDDISKYYRLKIHFLININDNSIKTRNKLTELIDQIIKDLVLLKIEYLTGLYDKICEKMSVFSVLYNYEKFNLLELIDSYNANIEINKKLKNLTGNIYDESKWNEKYKEKILIILNRESTKIETNIRNNFKNKNYNFQNHDTITIAYFQFSTAILPFIREFNNISLDIVSKVYSERIAHFFTMFIDQMKIQDNIDCINLNLNTSYKISKDVEIFYMMVDDQSKLMSLIDTFENNAILNLVNLYKDLINKIFQYRLSDINTANFTDASISKLINLLEKIYNPNISNDTNKKILTLILKNLKIKLLDILISYDVELFNVVNIEKIKSEINDLKEAILRILTSYKSEKDHQIYIDNFFYQIDALINYVQNSSTNEEKLILTFQLRNKKVDLDLYDKLFSIKSRKSSMSSKIIKSKNNLIKVGNIVVNSTINVESIRTIGKQFSI